MSRKRKRCLSASPSLGWRCELKRNHIRYSTDTHVAGFSRWTDSEGSTWAGPQAILDEAHLFSVSNAKGFLFNTRADAAGTLTSEGVPLFIPGPSTRETQLRDWWMNTALNEADGVVDKAIEYGATDLIDIGLMLARTMDREITNEEAAELGVFFYLIGKVARWQSAIQRGVRCSDDTLLDIGVYVRMAQRIRATGGWPGTKDG